MKAPKALMQKCDTAVAASHVQISEAPKSVPLLLDIHQIASALGVGRTTIENWTRSRRIPSIKIKRVLRYDLKKVMAALEAYERKAIGS